MLSGKIEVKTFCNMITQKCLRIIKYFYIKLIQNLKKMLRIFGTYIF